MPVKGVPVPGLSAWAVRRPLSALIAWFVALAIAVGLGVGIAGAYNDAFELPDTESKIATDLLRDSGTDLSTVEGGATIVWSPATGAAVGPDTGSVVLPILETIATLDSVTCVTNPFDPTGRGLGPACASADIDPAQLGELLSPEEVQTLAGSFAPVSTDGTVAFAAISFPVDESGSPVVSARDARIILDTVTAADNDALRIGVQGQLLEFAGQEPPSSEGIGIAVAIVILLIAFGSIVAAGLPIVTALVGLGGGLMLVSFIANFLDVATFAPTLAAMIGLGVGIDYALFVINRYRQALLIGHEPKAAAMEAVETAGRAVVFAGSAVIIGLLGLLILGINFFTGLAIGAAMTVVMVMLSAVWMLPALLSLLGTKALALRLPWGQRPGTGHAEGRAWARYGHGLQRMPWLTALLALGFVVVLAIPALSLRQGFADDSGKPIDSPARIAYDLRAAGFGAGSNGPFLVVADLTDVSDPAAFGTIVAGLANAPGVARTSPSIETLPILGKLAAVSDDAQRIQAIGVIPASAPQDEATADLLETLRNEINPALAQATGAKLYVGGAQAVTQDFTTVLSESLTRFLLVVVGLGFIALVILFRSIVVPLTGAITSLLSLAAAMGITVAVFQWGWFSEFLGIPGTGPIFPFVPIMVFAILFGLSMDYQVFLVSRMQEEWMRTRDNAASVRRGLAGSGRVVVIAAAIMSSVFLAFVPSTNSIIKLFGVALASAVLIDAFVVRLILVPSVMFMLGKVNWWLPGWLNRILPTLKIEPGEDEVADVPADDRAVVGKGA